MFQLVFKGECVPGTDLETARNNARTLFKASLDQVDRMFSGQPVVIRNKLEEVQAEKYRAVLKKHGMVAYVQPMGEARPAAGAAAQPRPSAPANQPRQQPEPASRPAEEKRSEVPETEPGDRLPVAGDKVDTILSGSGLSLDPVGVTLAEKTEVEPPMFQHLEEWSLAPPGSDLGVERDLPPPVIPDVSHLSLADDDSSERK
ncbi:hypothetical protein A8B84_14340 [Marinobacter sp. EhC06]|jgi:hypothetical protein|uniref:hypothetical protein n=1 Tax=Marinobacter TaxID=2742 RepID=UPI0007D8DC33|nr:MULTISPECIES: hypothetical protein [unclassified Marinobacter]OAN87919.1 hypothetical protein A8B84_14340 [Marinobacter sp. EhC06]OAN90909.1 hypothetical protein A8B80_20115 [Marinobacter sp. EhN04]